MRTIAACLLMLGIWAQAQEPAQPLKGLQDTWLEGTIGRQAVRMFVGPGRFPLQEGRIWGGYFYTRAWEFIPLEGESLPSGVLRVYEGDPSIPQSGRARLELTIDSSGADGKWTSADGARTQPVELRKMAKPPLFKDAMAHPKTFADPAWPITFTYPDSWPLKNSGTSLVVQSPDPFDMIFENQVECERGTRLPPPPADGEPPKEFRDGFYRTHDGWVATTRTVEFCDEPDSKCVAPHTRSNGRAIIMDADISYRAHNPWGFAGMAEAVGYLAIDGDRWAYCFDRVFDTRDRISLSPSVDKR